MQRYRAKQRYCATFFTIFSFSQIIIIINPFIGKINPTTIKTINEIKMKSNIALGHLFDMSAKPIINKDDSPNVIPFILINRPK